LRLWQSAHPHHQLKNVQVMPVMEKAEKKRGRPKKDELLKVSYLIEGEIELNEDALIEAHKNMGKFVLASNKVDLDPEVMLNYYKGQQAVERGFRFLKDKDFHVSEVYLKKEERIEALCMIMVLSLLVYSFAEWKLRQELKETEQTIPNQLSKPTQRPTMHWVFEIFMGVIISAIMDGGMIIKTIVHLWNGVKCEMWGISLKEFKMPKSVSTNRAIRSEMGRSRLQKILINLSPF
jgi:transposase